MRSLVESLLDDEDIQMDNLSNIAEIYKWVDKFSSTKNFKKTIEEFVNELKKSNLIKIKHNSIKGGEKLFSIRYNNSKEYYEVVISFFFPIRGNEWGATHIAKIQDRYSGEIKFLYPSSLIMDKSALKRYKELYILPDKYGKLIDLIREKAK